MTTWQKLWLGFGTLTALLVLVCVAFLVRVWSIQGEQGIVGFTLILLIVGVVVALVTSGVVGRGVVSGERVIAEQAERLRTTLASIGDAVITTDTEGRITNLNGVAETLTGWTSGEAMGQPLEAVSASSTRSRVRRSRTR